MHGICKCSDLLLKVFQEKSSLEGAKKAERTGYIKEPIGLLNFTSAMVFSNVCCNGYLLLACWSPASTLIIMISYFP